MAVKNIILGTAGISTRQDGLCSCPTRIECDRWRAERQAGDHIVLGYAHLTSFGIRWGSWMSRGHERFVNRMVAGGRASTFVAYSSRRRGDQPQTRNILYLRDLGIQEGHRRLV
jgi:hypothetical protein